MTSEASLQTSAVTVLQGLATGTLLYVVFFEVIEKERLKKTNGLLMVRVTFYSVQKKKSLNCCKCHIKKNASAVICFFCVCAFQSLNSDFLRVAFFHGKSLFPQVAFIVLGAVIMTLVQYIEVVTSQEEAAAAELLAEEAGGHAGGAVREIPCRLEKFDPQWPLPLDMVCKNGVLDIKTYYKIFK